MLCPRYLFCHLHELLQAILIANEIQGHDAALQVIVGHSSQPGYERHHGLAQILIGQARLELEPQPGMRRD